MASKYTLTTQPTAKAVKFAFYGPEGVGKTTLASKLPGAVTIDTEGKEATYLAKGGKATKVSAKYKTSIEEFGFGQ